MNRARVSAIAAIGRNRELGKKNGLVWRISDDLKRVKALTMGHTLVMGRKTYESIGRPLPGRTTIVVSRGAGTIAGCEVRGSIEEALGLAHKLEDEQSDGEIFIFGGAQIFEAAFPETTRLYLTLIDAEDPDADTFFPDYSEFSEVLENEKRDQNGLVYEWVTLERP